MLSDLAGQGNKGIIHPGRRRRRRLLQFFDCWILGFCLEREQIEGQRGMARRSSSRNGGIPPPGSRSECSHPHTATHPARWWVEQQPETSQPQLSPVQHMLPGRHLFRCRLQSSITQRCREVFGQGKQTTNPDVQFPAPTGLIRGRGTGRVPSSGSGHVPPGWQLCPPASGHASWGVWWEGGRRRGTEETRGGSRTCGGLCQQQEVEGGSTHPPPPPPTIRPSPPTWLRMYMPSVPKQPPAPLRAWWWVPPHPFSYPPSAMQHASPVPCR